MVSTLVLSIGLPNALGNFPTPFTCSTALDCQLSGLCVNGACQCDVGWRGASCGQLDLLPNPPGHLAYRPLAPGGNADSGSGFWNSWASAPIRDRKPSGTYVMSQAIASDEQRPFGPMQASENNVYGCEVAVSTPPIYFLGKTAGAPACQQLCEVNATSTGTALPSPCLSFTWHDASLTDGYANLCYGRTDATWGLVPESGHTSALRTGVKPVLPTPPPPPPPPTPFACDIHKPGSCNNAGVCDAASMACACDPTWRGPTCAELSLLPAQSKGNGLHNHSMNTWGGSIIPAVAANATSTTTDHVTHHMFASWFENSTLANWETRSVVVHAVSTTGAQGPYRPTDVVLAPRHDPALWDALDCHNPTVHRIGDEYVIFYIGVGVQASGSAAGNASAPATGGMHHRGRRPLGQDLPQVIGAAFSASLDGPWTRMPQPLLRPTEAWECDGFDKQVHPVCVMPGLNGALISLGTCRGPAACPTRQWCCTAMARSRSSTAATTTAASESPRRSSGAGHTRR
jgi:hypothetical protein